MQEPAERGQNASSHNVPQDAVVCTGWHALCTDSFDCKMRGNIADCNCLMVNEPHLIATAEIQDAEAKRATQIKCTSQHPCEVDEAPVCQAIKDGKYTVDAVKYSWVSTYSYRGWCSSGWMRPKACDPTAPGYTGDLYWAICDAAPCTKIQTPTDPNKPLSCQCRVETEPFLGANDRCTGENGGIMSSIPLWAWDFKKNAFPFPMPGYDYVQGACAPMKSDPLPAAGSSR